MIFVQQYATATQQKPHMSKTFQIFPWQMPKQIQIPTGFGVPYCYTQCGQIRMRDVR